MTLGGSKRMTRHGMRTTVICRAALVVGALVLAAPGTLFAQAPATPPVRSKPEELMQEQAQIAEKFKRFEQVVKLLAQFSDETNRDQARLLRQVFEESQSRSLDVKFDALVKLLAEKRLGDASSDQEKMTEQLEALLAILSSAEREKELKQEQNAIRDYLKKVKELLNKQREVQGRTVEGDPKEQAPDEQKLADEAAKLADRMAKAAAKNASTKPGDKPQSGEPKSGEAKPGDKPSDDKPQDGKPNDGKPNEGKPNEGKPSESKPGESKPAESKPSEGKPSEGKPSQGKPSEGKPSQGKPSDGQPSDEPPQDSQPQPPSAGDKTEAPQKRIAEAQKRMDDARKKLEEAKKDGALKDQDEAIRELEQAKAELEEILRQLREEELARLLAKLEQRFAEMLRMQEAVHRDTLVLHEIPAKSRGKAEEIEAGRLSRDEALLLLEADKALNILHEEGSAVALPATCEQMRDDVAQIVKLLAGNHVDELTIGVEEDVIAALKEMIEAFKKAQKDLKDKKNPPPGQGGGDAEPPLVDKIAELKMIRSLQLRVNKRTKLIAETAAKTADPDLLRTLQELAEREEEVHRITRDIVLGKNK